MSLETMVKTIAGDFRRASEFIEGTWQSSAEITKERINKRSLRDNIFYTNNHALYDVEDGDAFLYFGSKNGSIFRKDTINAAFEQLTNGRTGNYYRPSAEDVARAKQSSLRLRISDLGLKYHNESDDYGYFEVDTSDLTGSKLNDAQRRFAEAVYGSMEQDVNGNSDYGKAMKMLAKKGNIEKAEIYALRKETVLRDAQDGAIARAGWLNNFVNYSYFYADDCLVSSNVALRGVRSVAEGDARDAISPVQQAYNTILTTPLHKLNKEATPEIIKKMLQLATLYVTDKK